MLATGAGACEMPLAKNLGTAPRESLRNQLYRRNNRRFSQGSTIKNSDKQVRLSTSATARVGSFRLGYLRRDRNSNFYFDTRPGTSSSFYSIIYAVHYCSSATGSTLILKHLRTLEQ